MTRSPVISVRDSGIGSEPGGWLKVVAAAYTRERDFEIISARRVYEQFMAGRSMLSIARAYRLKRSDVDDVIRWWVNRERGKKARRLG